MRTPTIRFKNSWLHRGSELFLLCVSLGVALGLGAGTATIRDNGYLTHGFFRNALIALGGQLNRYAAAGVAAGLLMISVTALGSWWIRRVGSRRAGTSRQDSSVGPWPYAVALTVALVLQGAQVVYLGHLGKLEAAGSYRVWFVVVAALAWCGIYSLWRRASGAPSRLLGGALYFAPLAVITVLIAPRPGKLFLHWEVIAGLVAWCAASVCVAVFSSSDSGRFRPRLLHGFLVLVAILPLFVTAGVLLAPHNRRLQPANPKNVILIGIDTLRWDHTFENAWESRGHPITPRLQSLGRRGTVFQTAVSQAPWTMPAVASVLTGLYPRQHGATSLGGYLRPDQVTLSEILREAGYRTGGIVSHFLIDSQHGFSQGIDQFDSSNALGHWEITSEQVTDEALRFVRDNEDRRFFLFVHYFDPHFEYRDHPDWHLADEYSGWLKDETAEIWDLRTRRHLLQPADIRYLEDRYDEEIAFTDRQIGRLVDELDASGLTSRTAVMVFADHGEEFLERGWLGHTISLYDEIIHVPLIAVLPGYEEIVDVVTAPVETRAVFRTVLDYLGIQSGLSQHGDSLLPLIRPSGAEARAREESSPVFSEVSLRDDPMSSGRRAMLSAIRLGPWKLIRDHSRQTDRLFNIARDPTERDDLAPTETGELERLREALTQWLTSMPDVGEAPAEIDDVERERLKALGYL